MAFVIATAIAAICFSIAFCWDLSPFTRPCAAWIPAPYIAVPAVDPAAVAAPTNCPCVALIWEIWLLLAMARAVAAPDPCSTPACATCAMRSLLMPFLRRVAS